MKWNVIILLNVSVTPYAVAEQLPSFGLPPQIAEQVKARCAEVFPFYSNQVTCIELEAEAWRKLQGEAKKPLSSLSDGAKILPLPKRD